MNKSEIKEFCEFVEKKLKNAKGISFDEWSSSPFDKLTPVTKYFYSNGRKFTYNDQEYIISFTPARSGRGGMDEGSPDSYEVQKLTKQNSFNVNDLLARKEITIRDWMGGESRIDDCSLTRINGEYRYAFKENDAVLPQIIESIMKNTTYNIMIQRHDIGDITVWIDDKRFTQR